MDSLRSWAFFSSYVYQCKFKVGANSRDCSSHNHRPLPSPVFYTFTAPPLMQLALETMVDSLRGEISSMKHQLSTSQETMVAENAELQRELESAQQRLTLLQAQSETQKVHA